MTEPCLPRPRPGHRKERAGPNIGSLLTVFFFLILCLVMKHLTIPPKSPSTQSIVAALVWNEHDAGLHRGRWVESMNFIDCVVSCVATILGRVITILDVLPCVLDDMVNARFVCHGHQGFGFDSDGALSAPEFPGPHCLSLSRGSRLPGAPLGRRPQSRKPHARHRRPRERTAHWSRRSHKRSHVSFA